MGFGFYFSLAMLPVMIILTVIFLLKKKVRNMETKIYYYILITSIIMTSLEIVSALIYKDHFNTIFYDVIAKCVIISYFTLNYLFCNYLMSVCRKSKGAFKILKILSVLALLLIVFTEIKQDPDTIAPRGLPVIITFCYAMFLGIYQTILAITNRKTIKAKKFTPFYLFLVFGGISIFITIYYPTAFMIGYIWCLTIIIMNFTIENPDVKMLHTIEMAKEQAEKANRAKTDFLSSMSHEIRTPLNAIVGFSDYIMSSESIDEAKENAQDIINASQTLLEIVNGILDISKIEAGKMEIVNSKYNAKSTFESLAKLVTPKMKEKGLDFTYYIAPDLPETLFGDHANIKKVVTNLLSNAYKYTEKGAVRYEVNCVNSNNISKLIITVEDTGRGIKQESIDKLFTKFQRLDEDRNTTIEGTGLGLAITKQLIELMGGKILVHTVYGEGSKFTVVLNQSIEKMPVVVEEKIEIKTTLDLKDKKILLVDDNSLNIKVATKILERYNANNITSLDNGFDCIELIKSGKTFDIILMDDMMPKMSGVETFQKLKELEGFNQPVVILTANAITGMKEKYLNEGFEDYLAKPIEKEELIRVCNTIFQKYPSAGDEEENIELLEVTQEIKPVQEEKTLQTKETYLKENGVDLDKSLELLGDIEMYDMTISDFLTEVEEKWENINKYKNTNDMENYAIEVHSLKSDAKYLGFTQLADISYQHELKSKENDSSFVNEHFNELEAEYNKALTLAKSYNEMIK